MKSDAFTALLYGQTGRNTELHDCKMLYLWWMINVENRPHLASGLRDSSQIDRRQPLKAEQLRHQYVQKCDFDNSIWCDSFSVYDKWNECIMALCKHPQKKICCCFHWMLSTTTTKRVKNERKSLLPQTAGKSVQLATTPWHNTTFLPEPISWHKQGNNDHLAVRLKSFFF